MVFVNLPFCLCMGRKGLAEIPLGHPYSRPADQSVYLLFSGFWLNFGTSFKSFFLVLFLLIFHASNALVNDL